MPSSESSVRAFISPISRLCCLNAARILRRLCEVRIIIRGMSEKTIIASHMFIDANMMNPATIFITVIRTFSGPWWASSVMSNRSFVILDMSWPIFVSS